MTYSSRFGRVDPAPGSCVPSLQLSLLELEQLGEDVLGAAVAEPHGAGGVRKRKYQTLC